METPDTSVAGSEQDMDYGDDTVGAAGHHEAVEAGRGSALIIVLIVMLALTGLGLVAVRAVNNSLERSGTYRVRAEASDFSKGAARFALQRAHQNTEKFIRPLRRSGVDDMANAGSNTELTRQAQRGGYVHYVQTSADSNKRKFGDILGAGSDRESGLFVPDSGDGSFESMSDESMFEIYVMNPSVSMPVPGYSDEYCFRKVTIAARSRLGKFDSEWSQMGQVGSGGAIAEAQVGPLGQCQ